MHGEIKLYTDQDDNVDHESLVHAGATGFEDSRFRTRRYDWSLTTKKEIIETLERILDLLKKSQT